MKNPRIKKIIVTGVTGQDGSYMTDFLLKNLDCQVYGMVRRSAKPDYSNLKLSINNPAFQFVVGDLSDANSIETLVREIQPDYFINFAAQSFVGLSWSVPEQTFDVTATGVLRILESIRKHAPHCRFYSAGSSEEMGDVIYTPQDMNHPIRPRSPYGAAKAAARHLTKVYRESYDLYAVHGILYNHESERRGEEFVTRKITKGVARIAAALEKNEQFAPIELGNLESRRDWSHAEDFVEGVWRMLNQDVYRTDVSKMIDQYDKTGKILLPRDVNPAWHTILVKNLREYILSSNETHSIREFVEKAFEKAGIQGQWYITDNDAKSERYVLWNKDKTTDGKSLIVVNPKFYRPAEVDVLFGDSRPAREELGWTPKISFDKLVESMVQSDIDELSNCKKTT